MLVKQIGKKPKALIEVRAVWLEKLATLFVQSEVSFQFSPFQYFEYSGLHSRALNWFKLPVFSLSDDQPPHTRV